MRRNINKLQIALELQQINRENLDYLKDLSHKFKGNIPFNFLITGKNQDQKKDIELPMNSYGTKVKICKEFFDTLSNSSFIYRLNNESRWLNLAIEVPTSVAGEEEEVFELMEEVEID